MTNDLGKQKFAKLLKEEFDLLTVESIKTKDYKKLRELYVIETGDSRIDEGKFGDWVKSKLKGAKDAVVGMGKKASNVFAGIKDIGLGSGTTILGGEETFDIEKRKAKRAEAKAKVEGWLSKLPSQNPLVAEIKEVFTTLDQEEFPNTKDRAAFDSGMAKVQEVYKKVVDAFEKSGKTEADAKASNTLIAVLRGIVVYFQDFRIADKYIYLKEQEEPKEEEPIGSAEGEGSKSAAAAYSKKLPLGLALAGASMVGLGFAVDSPMAQEILMGLKDVGEGSPDTIAREITGRINVKSGQGMTQVARDFIGGRISLDQNAPLSNLLDPQVKDVLQKLAENATPDPAASMKAMKLALAAAESGNMSPFGVNRPIKTIGELFKFTDKYYSGRTLQSPFGIKKVSFDNYVEKAVKGEAGADPATLKNKAIGYISKFGGPVLKALGLGALAGAGVSAAMRLKGSQSSRMNDLRDLVIAMPDVKVGGGTQQPEIPGGEGTAQGPEGQPVQKEPTSPATEPTSPSGQEPTSPEKEPATNTSAAGKGKRLIKPEEFMKGALSGEPGEGEAEREITNFYAKRLPDAKPEEIKKVLGWLARNERLISEFRKKLGKILREAIGGMGTGERGRFKSQVGTEPLGKVKDEEKFGTPAEAVTQELVQNISNETGIEAATVAGILQLVLKNQKLASSPKDAGKAAYQGAQAVKTPTQPSQAIAKAGNVEKYSAVPMRGKSPYYQAIRREEGYPAEVGQAEFLKILDALNTIGGEEVLAENEENYVQQVVEKSGVDAVKVSKLVAFLEQNGLLKAEVLQKIKASAGSTVAQQTPTQPAQTTPTTQPAQAAEKVVLPSLSAPPEEWEKFYSSQQGSEWRKKHLAAGGKIDKNNKPVDGLAKELNENYNMRSRFMKLAGILKG